MLKWLAAKFENRKAVVLTSQENPGSGSDEAPPYVTADEWRKRGNAFLGDEKLVDAEQCYRNGIAADPANAICHSNLGYVLFEQRRWVDAEAMLKQAVELNPEDFDAHYMLATLCKDRDEWLQAIVSYRKALNIQPDFDLCRRDLCIALAQSGQPKEAQLVMSQGPAFGADPVNFHYFSGNLHLETGNYAAAAASFSLAKQLKPDEVVVLFNLSTAQIRLGDHFSALNNCKAILALQPDNAQAYANMASAYQMLGERDTAMVCYRKALEINPQYLYVHQNLLFDLTYLPECTPREFLDEAKRYGKQVSARAEPFTHWLCMPPSQARRPLRVGFVSADLCFHPVSFFLVNVLTSLDPARVCCIAYSSRAAEDAFTAHLKTLFAEWRSVSFMTDRELAEEIHSDGIDVLVDLSGHTGQTRLPVFAWRSAPVQVAWLGYWATTGVAEMDYILVDKTSVRADEAQFYSETPWFLPDTRLCFSPPTTLQPVLTGSLPALRNGYVSFATYQAQNKITDATLALWRRILEKMPSARLRMHGIPMNHEATVIDVKRRLTLANIDIERVDLIGRARRDDYLRSYAEVDLVLDTFPYPGGTTTAEALWMGVPTLTLTGDTLLARQGESMLHCTGLDDWVARNEEDYVQLAVDKATDLDSLADLRSRLRARVLASPLFDSSRFARNLEDAFDGMVKAKARRETAT
ncbi:MAG: tetratricopeptide repeat protein [Candidatus Saccharibacteria bacterium]|nr:tetratricopeptide repeat protein [Rhodoferax sp.]